MSGTINDTKKILLSLLRDAIGASESTENAIPLLDALDAGRFSFEREIWYDLHAPVAGESQNAGRGELLLRARTAQGALIKLDGLDKMIGPGGAYNLFDALIVLSAVEQAIEKKQFPISVNISARNACDRDSLFEFHKLLDRHFGGQFSPDHITFEFLEDDQADSPDHASLQEMRALGYKFALDDQSHEKWDERRPQNLGEYVDYIKIDGKTLNGFKDGAISLFEFQRFMDRLKKAAPQAEFLCEWVLSPEEAQDLADVLPDIRFVQGRELQDCCATFGERARIQHNLPGNRFVAAAGNKPVLH